MRAKNRRTKKRHHSLRSKRNRRVLRKHKNRCFFCGRRIRDNEDFSTHHIVARADGGKDTYENKAPAHLSCHQEFEQQRNQERIDR